MSSDTIITVENLGKKYSLRHQRPERYTALRDVLTEKARAIFRRNGKPDETREEFWALKDISFEVKRGDVLGIIGRNGAGKSTLLKILSRITEPTTGKIRIKGRVASLLEVGTGFHPELTGRENIFLNGAILGMGRAEIKKKFDEIVAFAETEKFLDTPVKRYSSGMYVRLAFAVAAHLEPEILIVDEVLAVGDAQFQKKCVSKMEQASTTGHTVLVVSHNMATIQRLCSRAVLLEKGRLIVNSTPVRAIEAYQGVKREVYCFAAPKLKSGSPSIVEASIAEISAGGTEARMHVKIHSGSGALVALDIRLKDLNGVPVGLGSLGALDPQEMIHLKSGVTEISLSLQTASLASGFYFVSFDLTTPGIEYHDRRENCLAFELERQPRDGKLYALPQEWNHGSLELVVSHSAILYS
jgi:lipopolysaccharide transport system ATP-binding protein